MLKQMSLEKMNKSAKALKTVMSVFYVASIVGIVISLIIAICSVALPNSYFSVDHFRNGGFSLDVNGIFRYDLNGSNLSSDVNMKGVFESIAFAAFVYSAAMTIIFKELRDILITVTKKEPFNEKNAERLTRISAVIIVGSVLFNFINNLVAGLIIDTLEIKYINVVTSINISMLLTGFLILILAGIFKYGCYLQKEHDETV
jgi:hypothetical protein